MIAPIVITALVAAIIIFWLGRKKGKQQILGLYQYHSWDYKQTSGSYYWNQYQSPTLVDSNNIWQIRRDMNGEQYYVKNGVTIPENIFAEQAPECLKQYVSVPTGSTSKGVHVFTDAAGNVSSKEIFTTNVPIE